MTQVLSLVAPRHMDIAPVHSRMDIDELSRDNGSETGFRTSLHTSPSSSPIGESMERLPPVSMSTPNPSHDVLEQLRINTSTSNTMRPDGTRDMICLCTPTPKIPRPRNAFILYRQHHQSRVTADNPRLSNPEISKIIGERWKNEVSEVKETWKKLAEEEKQRHQHQYPNYRYQPRRGAKSQNWSGSSNVDDQGRCHKCNGRFIATPRTPSVPFVGPTTSNFSHSEPQARPTLHRLNTDIPRRTSIEISPINKLPFPGKIPSFRSPDDYDPTSPDVKRRRANGAGDYHLVSGRPDVFGGMTPGEPMRLISEGGPAVQMNPYTPTSLPELGALPRSKSFPMPPPPRPSAPWSWSEQGSHSRRNSGFDESLRLPPLQSAISLSPSRQGTRDERHLSISSKESGSPIPIQRRLPAKDVERKSLESDVMSIAFRQKLGVLARICRPIPPLSREALFTNVRGALIAVEGPSASVLREVGMAVERGLTRYAEISLKVWTNDFDISDARASVEEDRFSSCFQTVLSWQEKSRHIVRHITGGEESHPGEKQGVEAEQNKAKSPVDDKSPDSSGKIPVALIREGFSLTLSDRFACTTPIVDMYAPVDHWQWMASLWRGIVCPDLVIYVKPSEEDEISTLGSVEFSRHMGLIVVRVAPGKGLEEATERRLAFEVMEWMREGSFRGAVPQNWRLG